MISRPGKSGLREKNDSFLRPQNCPKKTENVLGLAECIFHWVMSPTKSDNIKSCSTEVIPQILEKDQVF